MTCLALCFFNLSCRNVLHAPRFVVEIVEISQVWGTTNVLLEVFTLLVKGRWKLSALLVFRNFRNFYAYKIIYFNANILKSKVLYYTTFGSKIPLGFCPLELLTAHKFEVLKGEDKNFQKQCENGQC